MRRRVHQGWTEGSGRLLCIDSTILTGALHAHGGHLNSQAGHPAKCYPACCAGRLRLACLVSTWLAAQRHTQLRVHLKAHTEKTRWKKPSGMPHPHEHGERVFLPYQVLPHLPRLEPWQHLHTRACGHKGNRAFSVWQGGVQGPCKSIREGGATGHRMAIRRAAAQLKQWHTPIQAAAAIYSTRLPAARTAAR